jgi:hypothetical protein
MHKYANQWKNYLLNEVNEKKVLEEGGLENIKALASKFKEAEIWFHIDLDGVTSAIAMREYLKRYGIKTVEVYPIQYGDQEFSAHKPTPGRLFALVDYAHGKPTMHIHTDHHETQTGIKQSTSTHFAKARSNAGTISSKVAPYDLYSAEDIEVINMVDSADFARNAISPMEIGKAAFQLEKEGTVEKNKIMLGLATNRLLLAYKARPGFMEAVIMNSSPSLRSMYLNIKKLANTPMWKLWNSSERRWEEGQTLPTPGQMYDNHQVYIDQQKKSKDMFTIGEKNQVIMQYGSAGNIFKPGSFQRYTAFRNNPGADYLCIMWPMGIIQLSKNPFNGKENPYNLGELCFSPKGMGKFEPFLKSDPIALWTIKRISEKGVNTKKGNIETAMKYTYSDFVATYGGVATNLPQEGSEEHAQIVEIMDKYWKDISRDEESILSKIDVTAWDIIKSNSGGHKDITNISGFDHLNGGKNYTGYMKEIWSSLGLLLADTTDAGDKVDRTREGTRE